MERRLTDYGPNRLPRGHGPGLLRIFLHQFLSPFIYILLAAALVSMLLGDWSDAVFIFAVLLINAAIGTSQEYSAQRAALSLNQPVSPRARVLRAGASHQVDAEALVPGDIVLLEAGSKVPADLRLLRTHDLQVDVSMLTGESIAVLKDATCMLPVDTTVGDRRNMAFAGTLVSRGRATGLVTATGMETEIGAIAGTVSDSKITRAPLLVRMTQFTYRIAGVMGVAIIGMAFLGLLRGIPLDEIFLAAVALAVALTIALAVAMKRMARHNVIVRRLVAVEALGSCTFIATDKTGTLTRNQLSVSGLIFPDGRS